MAWKKIVGGTWQVPLELAKAEILQYEFNAYRRKYQESGVLSHESKALESDVNSLLGGWCDLTGKITGGVKVDNLREWEVSRDSEVAVYSSTKTSLKLGLEDTGYEESERFDYGFPEIDGRGKLLNVDLSHILEEQRYLKVSPSDNDDSMTLETINGKEYFVKLKELEMNEEGEFVMTLRSSSSSAFQNQIIESSRGNLLLSSDKKLSFDNTDEQATQLSKNGFTRIDGALANIFNNLIIKV